MWFRRKVDEASVCLKRAASETLLKDDWNPWEVLYRPLCTPTRLIVEFMPFRGHLPLTVALVDLGKDVILSKNGFLLMGHHYPQILNPGPTKVSSQYNIERR